MQAKRWRGGMHDLGLAEHGVGFVSDEHNRDMLPMDVVEKARAIEDKIVRGEIAVPST